MIIYCTERFKVEFKKLLKYNAYRRLEREIIDNSSDDQIRHGSTISQSEHLKIVKKRLGGSSGFRAYFYFYIISDGYLSFVYPKTGPERKISLNKQFQKLIIDETEAAIQSGEVFKVSVSNGKLVFTSQAR